MKSITERVDENAYYMGNIQVGKNKLVKSILETSRIPYYIPAEDPTLSYSFKYIFCLPNFINLIFIKADSKQLNNLCSNRIPLEFYLNPEKYFVTKNDYELLCFVIHRETPGIVLDGEGVKPGKKIKIRVKEGPFKGFEGVLPMDPEDGYALVLEIPPLFSWQIPVDKQFIEILPSPVYSCTKY